MKKFLVMMLAAGVCLAFAMPAAAKVTIQGMLTTDIYYLDQDEHFGATGGLLPDNGNGLEQTRIDMPPALERLTVKWANDDNTVRGYIQLRGGGRGGASVAGGDVYFNYLWIDWQLSPTFYLRFGRQTQAFAIMAPQQFLGQNSGHIVGAGFGNVHGGSARDAVRAYIKLSDNVRLELQALDPDNDSAEVVSGFTPTPGGILREENTIPRFDVAVPITLGNVTIEPSGTYLTQDYDQVGANQDDSVDIWGLALGVKAGFGVFSFAGELTIGENLGVGNYAGGTNAVPSFFVSGGRTNVEDAQIMSWWGQVGIKLGPSTLYLVVGQNSVELDNAGAVGAKTEIDRAMYGISWPIAVSKGLTLRPEAFVYDFDDGATVAGTPQNLGEEKVVGLQVMLTF